MSVVSATIIILAQLVIQGGTVIKWIGAGYIRWWSNFHSEAVNTDTLGVPELGRAAVIHVISM